MLYPLGRGKSSFPLPWPAQSTHKPPVVAGMQHAILPGSAYDKALFGLGLGYNAASVVAHCEEKETPLAPGELAKVEAELDGIVAASGADTTSYEAVSKAGWAGGTGWPKDDGAQHPASDLLSVL